MLRLSLAVNGDLLGILVVGESVVGLTEGVSVGAGVNGVHSAAIEKHQVLVGQDVSASLSSGGHGMAWVLVLH